MDSSKSIPHRNTEMKMNPLYVVFEMSFQKEFVNFKLISGMRLLLQIR